ncbi:MAG: DnaJ domain-containing protein [Methylococcales bacterium]|nr:DnaJ domain-containing protein [Methylococcales bacterium]
MIRLILLALLLAGLLWALRWLLGKPPAMLAQQLRRASVPIVITLVVVLALTGRLNAVLALLGVILAGLMRVAPVLARLAPEAFRLWQQWRHQKPAEAGRGAGQRQTRQNSAITAAEAYQILGLQPGASREQVVQAHRRMMQKYHPDRGGSDYFAARINLAKDMLLQH